MKSNTDADNDADVEPDAIAVRPLRKRLPHKIPPALPAPPAAAFLPVKDPGEIDIRRCHACGDGSSQFPLDFLDSLWRIVLICPRCVLSLHSSSLCCYCFKSIPGDSADAGVACSRCGRSAHPGCVPAGSSPPGRIFVCLDCWVPPAYARRYPDDWKASVFGDGASSLEKVVRNSVAKAQKSAVLAAKARIAADKKANLARSAAELAKGAVDCAAACGADVKLSEGLEKLGVFEDKEVALLLHRAINCSPRFYIRRQRGSLNSPAVDDHTSPLPELSSASNSSEVIKEECEEGEGVDVTNRGSLNSPAVDDHTSPLPELSSASNSSEVNKDECKEEGEDVDVTSRYGKTYIRKRLRADTTTSSPMKD